VALPCGIALCAPFVFQASTIRPRAKQKPARKRAIVAGTGGSGHSAPEVAGGARGDRSRLPWFRLILIAILVLTVPGLRARRIKGFSATPPVGEALAEFGECQGLLLAWDNDLTEPQYRVLTDIVRHARNRLEVCLLVADESQKHSAATTLRQAGVSPAHVSFVVVPLRKTWARDFGPVFVKAADGRHEMLDFVYSPTTLPHLNAEDRVPQGLASALAMPVTEVPLALDGGNLLSNGQGLLVTSEATLKDNPRRTKEEVSQTLRHYVGAQQVVFLEPLYLERTGHVDVFCTFTSPDTVLVGRYEDHEDEVNAAILDRNAQRLAKVRTPHGPLRVERITMPRRGPNKRFWSYTNVVYANGLVLVPVYPELPAQLNEAALATFRRLLPTWEVVGIDATPLMELDGALHCATANLYRLGPEK